MVTMMLAWVWASLFMFYEKVLFNEMSKALSGELFCMWMDLMVFQGSR